MAVKSQNVDEITVTTNGGSQSEANGVGTSKILAETATDGKKAPLYKVLVEEMKFTP